MIGAVIEADLAELIKGKDWDGLREALSELDPPDLAEVIIDLPEDSEGMIFRMLTHDQASAAFSYLPFEHQEVLIQSLSGEQMRAIVAEMTPDDRARLFDELPAEVTRRLLEFLSPAQLKTTRD